MLVARCIIDEESSKKNERVINTLEDRNVCLLEKIFEKFNQEDFSPLHFISDWFVPGTTTRILTVAVVLPSGISPGQFPVWVSEDDQNLLLLWLDPTLSLI